MIRARAGREMGEYDGPDKADGLDAEDICVRCGMHRSEWKGSNGKGYIQNEEVYCCKDCAEDIRCICNI
jgi:hypothetical protein